MKTPILRYVKFVKNLVTALSVFLLLALMVTLVFALNGVIACMVLSGVIAVAFFVMYGVYTLRISMGAVIGMDITKDVIHVKTKRKTFAYDLQGGCIAVKQLKNRYVCTFQTQDSVDKFDFYKRVPFMKPYETCFTPDEIEAIYPAFSEGEEGE